MRIVFGSATQHSTSVKLSSVAKVWQCATTVSHFTTLWVLEPMTISSCFYRLEELSHANRRLAEQNI